MSITNIDAVMEKFYHYGKITLPEAENLIKSIEPDLIDWLEDFRASDDTGEGWIGGNESYGYENDQKILSNLEYISDRWQAAFRVSWMLGIVNEAYR